MAVLHYSFHSHPKIVGLPKATIGVYALALSYASANLTDGFVPDSYARHLDAKRRHFGGLTAAGLVAERPGGFLLLDYLDYNPSKAQVEEKRRAARIRMSRVRTNTPDKRQPSSREQEGPVTPHVHDIGKDNTLTELQDRSPRAEVDELAERRASKHEGFTSNDKPVSSAALLASLRRTIEEAS